MASCCFNFSSSMVSCGDEDGKVYIWHKNTDKLMANISISTHCINALRFYTNSNNFLVTGGDDETIKFFSIKGVKIGIS